jgi:uncharacterized protein (DUF2252 family)
LTDPHKSKAEMAKGVAEGKTPAVTADVQKRKERLDYGRCQRKHLARKAVAEINPKKRRFDPIELLLSKTDGRVPRLLPVKYSRMSVSPFAFFRGAISIMAADLAGHPHSNLMVQLCGDAHVQNMGSFGSPDGRIIFDINDFDETVTGPWEWDVKRMATSIALAGLESSHRQAECFSAVEIFVSAYCRLVEELAEMPLLTSARYQIHRFRRAGAISDALKQAERATPADLLLKYTSDGGNRGARFKKVNDVLWPITGVRKAAVLESLKLYESSLQPERLHLFRFFRPLDVAFKIVGTGSVGLRDYVVLMEGNGAEDALFLQLKQETASAYAEYLNVPAAHEGRRVAEGQRRIQPLSDPLLGWTQIDGRDYLVRQLNDHKGSVDLTKLRGEGLSTLAEIAGELLARGHSRSGDPLSLKGYIGQPDRLIRSLTAFASKYARQMEADFDEFTKAIRRGRIKVAHSEAEIARHQ